MAVELANEEKMLGQFASNSGLLDLVEEVSKDYEKLNAFFQNGFTEDASGVAEELRKFISAGGDEDVISTASALLSLLKNQNAAIISLGQYEGEDEEGDAIDKAEANRSGVMIALMLPANVAEKYAVPGGEIASELHVTLGYFGKREDLTDQQMEAIEASIRVFVQTHGPLAITLGGIGRFPSTPSSDGKDVAYLGVHSPDIQKFRGELVEVLAASRVAPKSNFGYNPHVTLKYVGVNAPHLLPSLEPTSVLFDRITLCVGGTRTEFPLARSTVEIEGSISKLDAEQRIAFGWFSIVEIEGRTVEDTQGDRISPKMLESSAYRFVLEARVGGNMHEKAGRKVRGVARLVESAVFTREKQEAMQKSLNEQGIAAVIDLKCTAWWGGFKIEDPETWKQVREGKLRAWSIGGKGVREKI